MCFWFWFSVVFVVEFVYGLDCACLFVCGDVAFVVGLFMLAA